MTALLGIDAGNTGVKAVLFDEAGRELAHAHRETGGTSPAPGCVERDVGRLRRDLVALIAEVIARSGRPGSDIAAVGAAGHGNGLYLFDEDGEALVAIQSLDTRAAGLVEDWAKDGTADAIAAIAMQRPWPAQTPTLLAWMARNRREVVARARRLLLCKDIVTHALTGRLVSEVSDLGGAGLLALPENRFSRDLAEAYGLTDLERLMPDVLWPTDVAGTVTEAMAAATGLVAGTPVVAGLFDVVAGAVGTGVTRPGQASVIMGTWSINQAITPAPVAAVFMSCGVAPGRYMAMENSATSAANLEWAAHRFLGSAGFAEADRLAELAEPMPDGPLYLPYLYGSSEDPAARAVLFGAGGWHDAPALMRALFEGVAFAHVAHIDKLRAAGVPAERFTISGGGARSPVWPRMLADMLGESIDVSLQPEAGALGAAMAAAVGAGLYPSLDAAAAAMAAPTRAVEPDARATPLYRERYALWQGLQRDVAGSWRALRDLKA